MTGTISNNSFAYQTQWKDVERDIQASTGCSLHVASNVISYLFGQTVFRGIPEFVSYFQENESLSVPWGVALEIRDISLLDRDLEQVHPELELALQNTGFLGDISRVLYLLNTLMAAVGKRAVFDTAREPVINAMTWEVNSGHFSMTRSIDYRLLAVREGLHVRLTDLYRVMMRCGIPKLTLAPKQEMTILHRDRDIEKVPNKIHELFAAIVSGRQPPGFVWAIKAKELGWVDVRYASGAPGLKLCGDRVELSIDDQIRYYGIDDFLQRLEFGGKIEVPPNQKLMIKDWRIRLLAREQEVVGRVEIGVNPTQFILDQLLLPIGRSMELRGLDNGVAGLNYVRDDHNTITLSSPQGFIMTAGSGRLFANLRMLRELMIGGGVSSFTLASDQELWIYGFAADELQSIDENGNTLDAFQTALQRVVSRYNPIGFVWQFDFPAGVKQGHMRLSNSTTTDTLDVLSLSGNGGITVSLRRPTKVEFIY